MFCNFKGIAGIIGLSIFFLFAAVPGYPLHSISVENNDPDNDSYVKTSIAVQVGVFNGLTQEFVYNYGNKASELDWELSPLYYAGFTFNNQFFKVINVNFGYWSGINKDLGFIRDYDYNEYGETTNYSKHDCVLENFNILDFNLGYNYEIFKPISITGMLGYNYMNLKLSARDGFYEYPPGSARIPFYGTGITLKQSFYIPYIGLGATLRYKTMFYMQVFGLYSTLVYCEQEDYHFRRQIEFYASAKYGKYVSMIGVLGFKINEYTSFAVNASFAEITMVNGESKVRDLTTGLSTPSSPGTSGVTFHEAGIEFAIEHLMRWL